jgi:hypothetical protein
VEILRATGEVGVGTSSDFVGVVDFVTAFFSGFGVLLIASEMERFPNGMLIKLCGEIDLVIGAPKNPVDAVPTWGAEGGGDAGSVGD